MSSAPTKDIKARIRGKASGCPFHTNKQTIMRSSFWPNSLNLKALSTTDPAAGQGKTYAEEFVSLDLDAVKADIMAAMTTSQSWWPSDYGTYAPFFIRMAWHSAGTYRTFDGRGGAGTGNMRLAPLNSWPDNGNLDKARRLLWPVKKKYGRKLSWADLMIYAGNVALESMGFQTFGFGGGRVDIYEPEGDIYWGPEGSWLAAERGGLGDGLQQPLGAVQMGLIYVNPEGPGGNPDPLQSAQDIRTTFARMHMNDYETVALIAGGHTFGKGHGAGPTDHVGPEPEGAPIENQGFGWMSSFKSGKGEDTITSGLEGAWTSNPTQWDNGYFENLFKYDWEQTKSPAGATLWRPTDRAADTLVPLAHDSGKKTHPIMFTSDLALKMDPEYQKISKRFHENPDEFADAFARAWYKLCHRDMGPHERLLGKLVPEPQIWQDPVPASPGKVVSAEDITALKAKVLEASGASVRELVLAAWGSASTYRCTDHRGGSNGGRILLEPQNTWPANSPEELAKVSAALAKIRKDFNDSKSAEGVAISMADMIILGGAAAIEAASKAAGSNITVPFTPGRGDATAESTDTASFGVLEPTSDGFRNYLGPAAPNTPQDLGASAEALLIERAYFLKLSRAEMAVLVAGMRALNANTKDDKIGVLTSRPGQLTNDFFVNLCDMDTQWKASEEDGVYHGISRSTSEIKWRASRVDLIFGSNAELRCITEYYACDDAEEQFRKDFVKAWVKVMRHGHGVF